MIDLTETPTFDPTVTVPEGDDDMRDAADRVAELAQVLANRTRALKVVTDVAARLDVPNTFASDVTVTGALIATHNITAGGTVHAADDVTASGAVTAGGSITAAGNLNAGVDVHGTNITALGNVNALGSIVSAHDVTASGNVHAADDVTASGAITAGGSVSASGNVRAGANFLYTVPLTVEGELDVADGVADLINGVWQYDPGSGMWYAQNGSGDGLAIPIRIPFGVTLLGVDVLMEQVTATPVSIQFVRRQSDWLTSGAPPADGVVNMSSTPATLAGWYVLTVDFGAGVAAAAGRYEVRCFAGHGASGMSGDKVARARVRWTNPGPRTPQL